MQLTATPQPTGNGLGLSHELGRFPYNPAAPAAAFATRRSATTWATSS